MNYIFNFIKKTSLLLAGLFLFASAQAKTNDDRQTLAQLIYQNLNDNSEMALKFARQLEELAENKKDTVYWTYALSCQGSVFNRYLNYSASLKVLEKAYDLDKNNFNTIFKLATAHLLAGGEERARFFFQKALEVDSTKKNVISGGIGLLNLYNKRYDEAKENFYKELALVKDIKDSINAFVDLGYYYLVTEEYEKAKEYLSKAEAVKEDFLKENSSKKQFILAALYSNWGQYYIAKGEALQAEKYFNQAMEIAGKLHYGLILEECYKGLQMVSVYKKDVEMNSYYWQKQKDFTVENSRQLTAYYDYLVAKNEEKLAEVSQLASEENRKHLLIIAAVSLLSLILIVTQAVVMKKRRKERRRIEALEKDLQYTEVEKTRLITELSTRLNLKD
jgi:tetratricopeptide (TPR) repeat protein